MDFSARTTAPLIAAALLAVTQSACTALSYHNNSYFAVNETPRTIAAEPKVSMVDRLGDGPDKLYAQGMELVGFSHFVSPLYPNLAEADARRTAVARGAEHVLMTKPLPQQLNQNYYLTTYWRKAGDFILGAYYQDLPPEIMGTVGCDDNAVVVMVVAENTPAAQLGLKAGDHLLYIDGEPVESAAFLDRMLVEKAGREVEIRAAREAGNFVGKVKLLEGKRPPSAGARAPWPVLGAALTSVETSAEEREKLGLGATKHYVSGIRYRTPACLADLSTGDIVLEVGGRKLSQASDVSDALATLKSDQLSLKILRGSAQIETLADLSALAKEAYLAAQRLDIREAQYVLPWREHAPKSWTALAVISATAAGVGPAYASYQQQKYQADLRAYAHYQRQAALAARQPQNQIISGSRGRTYVRSTTGELIAVDRTAAAKIAATPGGRIEMAGRRGSSGYLVDTEGNRTSLEPARPIISGAGSESLIFRFDNGYWERQSAMYDIMLMGMRNGMRSAQGWFPKPDFNAPYRPFPKTRSPF